MFLSSHLRQHFKLLLCHPEDTEPFEEVADLMVIRNAGPVAPFEDHYEAIRQRITAKWLKTYNAFNGNAEMNGKGYLLEPSGLGDSTG
ncbi:hypothetical protein [Paenibacillus albidus]|uniref:hypothetical protein n=1 Tax=Paenibacillus albidus TaxID=2041023 RepID=UPI002034CB20|nr:hypothetical protein [Paenibacillus albidus]